MLGNLLKNEASALAHSERELESGDLAGAGAGMSGSSAADGSGVGRLGRSSSNGNNNSNSNSGSYTNLRQLGSISPSLTSVRQLGSNSSSLTNVRQGLSGNSGSLTNVRQGLSGHSGSLTNVRQALRSTGDSTTLSIGAHPNVSATNLRTTSNRSASVFLRSLLGNQDEGNDNDDVTDVNTDSGGELTDSVSEIGSRTGSNSRVAAYPRMLDQIADNQRLELFGCKTMPYSMAMGGSPEEPAYSYRVLVAEETDQVACRNNFKVFLDHSYPEGADISKIRPNELKQYMFCSMFRAMNSKKYNKNEKFRAIPNSDDIILTRIIYISYPHNRIAINLCLPNFLLPVICEVWSFVQNWMDETERILTKTITEYRRSPTKAKLDFNHGHAQQLKKQIQTPQQVVQPQVGPPVNGATLQHTFAQIYGDEIERIVSILTNYLVPCFKSIYEIPRLFLFPPDDIRFVNTWFKCCVKWMEVKDGPKLSLLQTSLATVLVNYKDIMLNPGTGKHKETARIIVLSGNLPVANKLVFLIGGLLNKRIRRNLDLIDMSKKPKRGHVPAQTVTEPIAMKQNQAPKKQSVESSPSSMLSFSSVSSTSSTSSRFNPTRNGWEIPQRMSTSSASIAISPGSTATSGDVIQPSSFRSGESSMRYLSSSLTSQQNSYGSWFNSRPSITRMLSRSPSVSGSESSFARSAINVNKTASTLFRTPSTLSLQQANLRRNSASSNNYVPDPPALNDYEESAWFGTPESMGSVDMYRASTGRTLAPQTATDTITNTNTNVGFFGNGTTFISPLKDISIQRDCQRVDESALLDKAFDLICEPNAGMEQADKDLKSCAVTLSNTPSNMAPVAEIDFNIPTELQSSLKFNELLPRYTSYLPHLNRFFQIQANPYSSDSEAHILSTMRKNLHLEPNVSLVKTLVISLKTRDIYEMMVQQHSADDKDSQRMRKILSNGKMQLKSSSSSRKLTECINFINTSFDRVKEIYRLIDMHEADGHTPSGEYDIEILRIFNSIVKYMEDI